MPFHILLPVIGVGVVKGLEQAITKNQASCTVSILEITSSTIRLHSCFMPSHSENSKTCMVKLNRVHAREYSRCRAKDFWIDSGSFGSLDWSLLKSRRRLQGRNKGASLECGNLQTKAQMHMSRRRTLSVVPWPCVCEGSLLQHGIKIRTGNRSMP